MDLKSIKPEPGVLSSSCFVATSDSLLLASVRTGALHSSTCEDLLPPSWLFSGSFPVPAKVRLSLPGGRESSFMQGFKSQPSLVQDS